MKKKKDASKLNKDNLIRHGGDNVKHVLYFGHLNNRSYGDEIGWCLLDDFVRKHYRKKIKLHYRSVNAGKKLELGDYDFYLLGCGTCLSNLCAYYADQLLIQLANSKKRFGVFGAGVYFEEQRKQRGTLFKASPESYEKTAQYINSAEFIAVRDVASTNYLSNVSDRKIDILYDPGLSVAYPKIELKHRKPILGFNMAVSGSSCLGSIYTGVEHHNIIWSFLETKRDAYDLMFFSFNNKDVKLINNYAKKGVLISPYETPQRLCGEIQNCSLFVGIRVHSDITCAAYGIPFVSVTYTEPNRNFLDHINYPHRIMVQDITVDKLSEMFDAVESDQENISQDLKSKAAIARTTYAEKAHKLCKVILGEE